MQVLKNLRSHSLTDVQKGLAVWLVIAAIAGAVVWLQASPPGKQTVSIITTDAITLAGGEDVRVAGISVGKVSSIHLEGDHVRVDLSVDSSLRMGNATRADVRLLTVVGGYYIALSPGGSQSGDDLIPAERVTVPYTAADTLQALPRVTDNVIGTPLDQTLRQLDSGFGTNTNALRSALRGLQTVATVFDRQRLQIRSTLNLAQEYFATFNNSRGFVLELIRKTNIVISEYYTYRYGFSVAYQRLGDALQRLGAVAKFYVNHKDQLYNGIVFVKENAEKLRDGLDTALKQLLPYRDRLLGLLGPGGPLSQDGQFVLDATKMCIPLPGRTC